MGCDWPFSETAEVTSLGSACSKATCCSVQCMFVYVYDLKRITNVYHAQRFVEILRSDAVFNIFKENTIIKKILYLIIILV